MTFGRNVEQDQTTCSLQECDSGFLIFGVMSPFVLFEIGFLSAL